MMTTSVNIVSRNRAMEANRDVVLGEYFDYLRKYHVMPSSNNLHTSDGSRAFREIAI